MDMSFEAVMGALMSLHSIICTCGHGAFFTAKVMLNVITQGIDHVYQGFMRKVVRAHSVNIIDPRNDIPVVVID